MNIKVVLNLPYSGDVEKALEGKLLLSFEYWCRLELLLTYFF